MPSTSLRAVALGFTFQNGRTLFHDVDFQLPPGWLGVVGANGVGKTTLLELLVGQRTPTSGRIELKPRGATIAVCNQRVELLERSVIDFSQQLDGHARALQGRLKLEPSQLLRWPTLSPGERRRWQLGATLATQPEVLLLDEPSNHLDADAADWLLPELLRYRGIGVLVSHDRALLDALTTSTLRIDAGAVRVWPGNWSNASQQWAIEAERARMAHEQARADVRKAATRLQRARSELAETSAHRSTGKRMKNKHDSDARTLAADFRAEHAEMALAGRLRSEKQQLARAQERHQQTLGTRMVGTDFELHWLRAPRPVLLSHQGRTVGRTDRIWVRGANGAGKTTLLTALAAQRRADDALFFLPQELTSDDTRHLLAALHALQPGPRGHVLQWLAVLGVPPSAVLESEAPSAGEARKLALALALGQPMWGLLLDEPTHHLDAIACERLENALTRFQGALVLATHDRRFAEACTDQQWSL